VFVYCVGYAQLWAAHQAYGITPLEYRVADIKYRATGCVQPRASIPALEGRRATGGFEPKQFLSLCRELVLFLFFSHAILLRIESLDMEVSIFLAFSSFLKIEIQL
jgi:hypothetical protein